MVLDTLPMFPCNDTYEQAQQRDEPDGFYEYLYDGFERYLEQTRKTSMRVALSQGLSLSATLAAPGIQNAARKYIGKYMMSGIFCDAIVLLCGRPFV